MLSYHPEGGVKTCVVKLKVPPEGVEGCELDLLKIKLINTSLPLPPSCPGGPAPPGLPGVPGVPSTLCATLAALPCHVIEAAVSVGAPEACPTPDYITSLLAVIDG